MRRVMTLVVWMAAVVLASAPLMAETSNAVVRPSFLIIQDPLQVLRGPKVTIVKAGTGVTFYATGSDYDNNGNLNSVSLYVHDTKAPNGIPSDWQLSFSRAAEFGLKPGAITPRPGQAQPDPASFDAHLYNQDCDALKGSVTGLGKLEVEPSGITLLAGQFSYLCRNTLGQLGTVSGEFYFEVEAQGGGDDGDGGDGDDGDDDGGDDGGDGEGDDPAPPPSPQLQILFPEELGAEPLRMVNDREQAVRFNTVTNGLFDSPIQLEVTTTADPTEEFFVDIDPRAVAAPGDAEGHVTIRTGALTWPRDYVVTAYAFANGALVNAASFVVSLDCTSPFILGVDQPSSLAGVPAGTQATLQVKAGGSGPFLYQWYRGMPGMTGEPLQAENNAKVVLTPRETGPYWVRVRNACGSVDSAAAMVTVAQQNVTTRRARP